MKKKFIKGSLNVNFFNILVLFSLLIFYSFHLLDYKNFFVLMFVGLLVFLINLSYFSNKIYFYNLGQVICFCLNILLIYCIYSYHNNYFFKDLKYNDFGVYNIYVLKSTSTYSSLEKMRGKTLGVLKNDNQNNDSINSVIGEYKYYDSINGLYEAISNGEIQGFIVKECDFESLEFYDLRKIYTFTF